MPELPEVETIRRGVAPLVISKTIQDIEVRDKRLRWPVDEGALHDLANGQTITDVFRRSKYLVFVLSNGAHLVIHLGMTGRIGLHKEGDELETHTHVIFYLDELHMRYRDPRRFGYIDILPPGGLAEYVRFKHLGPEPLSDEFNPDYLTATLERRTGPIKSLLMNAAIVVGVGNIYVNEALFRAGIMPTRAGKSLDREEIEKLTASIKAVLNDAIASGGTTLNDYRNALGETGFFQLQLFVYQQEGEPCKKCGTPIEKVVITGRSTFYCKGCQV